MKRPIDSATKNWIDRRNMSKPWVATTNKHRARNLTGKIFGKWEVLHPAKPDKNGWITKWLCKCSCGKTSPVTSSALRHGESKQCAVCARKGRRKRPYERLYNRLTTRASLEVSLTYEEFLEFVTVTTCHYCDLHIHWIEQGTGAYNLDRKDNSLGYSKDNCVVCCKECNYIKGAKFSYEHMLKLCNEELDRQEENATKT
jgi:hypothetical protein